MTVPGSKSYAQRILAADFLAGGGSKIRNLTLCDDVRVALGIVEALRAEGHGPITIDAGESALAARMFTPIGAMTGRRVTVRGRGTLLRRPLAMMTGPLERLGTRVDSTGLLPVTVEGRMVGGQVEVDGNGSSQFVTGLLMALPLAERDSIIYVTDPHSTPYLAMTLDVVRRFGVEIENRDFCEFLIRGNQKYRPCEIEVEGDWSAAAAMLTAGAIAGGITVRGLNPHSLQADRAILDVLQQAGARVSAGKSGVTVRRRKLRAFDFAATDCPDLFPVLAVLASQCAGESHIAGAGRLIYKESDRAAAIVEQLGKLGIDVSVAGDTMTVRGGEIAGGECDSLGDHRIAMAAGIAGLISRVPVQVVNPEVTAKSYPDFWKELSLITKT